MYLVNTAPTFRVQFAPDGNPGDVGSDVTVTATRANGTSLATAAATTPSGAGDTRQYAWPLPVAHNTRLDLLRLDWLDVSSGQTVTTWAEIVGSLLVSEAAVRAHRTGTDRTPFTDVDRYPDALIMGWRQAVTEIFEDRLGQSFIERHARVELAGSGSHRLPLAGGRCRRADGVPMNRPGRFLDPGRVLAVTVDGVTVDPSNVVTDGFVLHRTDAVWPLPSTTRPLNVVVEYTYGQTHPDFEARERALELLAANLVPGDFPSRATALTNEDGTFRITTWPAAVEEFFKARDRRFGV